MKNIPAIEHAGNDNVIMTDVVQSDGCDFHALVLVKYIWHCVK
jgi:hypothetical protein